LRLSLGRAPLKISKMTSVVATQFVPLVATAAATKDFMVVSLHDIAPSNREVANEIISELSRHSVRVCSLLVVPDYHHQGLVTKDRQFVAWLRDLESDGHEIVIHGYFHERPRRPGESLRDKFLTRFYTHYEGEFYDLDYEEALRRITNARDEFRTGGLTPRGFVAPAWLLSAEAERAARDAELEYTTRLHTVRDLRSNQEFAARSIVYSVRSNWRQTVSCVWNAALLQFLKNNPLLRLSIHPPDYSHPAVWRQILRFIDMTDETKTLTTYRDWIAEQRLMANRKG
jgi:predicted deacetylase